MSKTFDDDDAASRPDDEKPEWSSDDFANARPALEVIADIFGPKAAEEIMRKPGRPAKPDRKINQTLRLDPDVVAAYRGQGPGWQAHMNTVLRQHMPRHGK